MPKTKSAAATKKAVKPSASHSAPAAASKTNYMDLFARRFGRDVMLGALFAEMIGTFVLTAIVLNTGGNAIVAALTVVIMSMVLAKLSGGHINPAVTLALLATRQISVLRAGGYLVAQVLGGMMALVIVTQFVQTGGVSPLTGEMPQVFAVDKLVGDWRPFLAELLGSVVFGIGIAAAVLGKQEGINAGFIVGGSLMLGLILATQASGAILNPAVALGLNAYHTDLPWTIWTYALAPVLGVTAGAWLYKLLKWDIESGKV